MTTDELEEGPDANQIRRHAKKMLSVREYNLKYRRLDFYKPHTGQLRFHNSKATEAQLLAGNQQGKSWSAAGQVTFDLLGFYPDWYEGARHVIPKVSRAFECMIWVAGPTSELVRDIDQLNLLGDLSQKDGLGSGLIPLDALCGSKPAMARGIANFADNITVRRETGGTANLSFKTYAQGRGSFQGGAIDRVLLDEQLPRDPESQAIYGECLARLSTTAGRIYSVCTPVLGRTEQRKRFDVASPEREVVRFTIDDATHISAEEREKIKQRYPEAERMTRLYGVDAQGSGGVFTFDEASITHTMTLADVPSGWCWLQAVDFQHASGASGHPFGYVLLAWDKDSDIIHVMQAWRMRGLPANHIERIVANDVAKQIPCSWPHDGHRSLLGEQTTIAGMYKKGGLRMRGQHATFPDGGYALEAGLLEMQNRLTKGTLKIAKHLHELWDELRNYHRDDNGLVVKVDDDILSALRVAITDRRFAIPLMKNSIGGFIMDMPQQQRPRVRGVDFDVFGH